MTPKKDLEQEQDAINILTHAMFSVQFLQDFSDFVTGPNPNGILAGQFWEQWNARRSPNQRQVPFSFGAFLGYMYLGLLWAKEHWFDLIPNGPAASAPADWGLSGVTITSPKEASPTLGYVIRRMRNALGHGNIRLNVPETMRYEDRWTGVSVSFWDANMRDVNDTFAIELSLERIARLIGTFRSLVHGHVAAKTAAASSLPHAT